MVKHVCIHNFMDWNNFVNSNCGNYSRIVLIGINYTINYYKMILSSNL